MEERSPLNKLLFGKIRNKLIFSFSILGVLMIILGFFMINSYQKISDISSDVKAATSVSEAALDFNVENFHTQLEVWEYAYQPTDTRLAAFKKHDDKLTILLNKLLGLVQTAADSGMESNVLAKNGERQVKKIASNLELVRADWVVLLGAIENQQLAEEQGNPNYENLREISNQYVLANEDLFDKLDFNANVDVFVIAQENLVHDLEIKQAALISLFTKLILILLGALILIGILVSIFISKSLTKPIKKLTDATVELEKGNFKTRVNIKTGDEMEQLGNSFNVTTEVLEKADEEHRQIDKAKTEFLSITSHEMRSPLTPMKAQLQMLEGEYFGKISKKQKDSIEIVLRNTNRLDKIIQDFLEISRIEAARMKFKFIRTNLIEDINRLIEEMKGLLPEKKISIIANIQKLPTIEVDPDRVMQVLRNLLNNAKKFSKENSKIIVNVGLEKDMIAFSVMDTGIGIDTENQPRVFEPFFQEEQTMYRKYQGTGLGLSICKGIVESQNGKIWVESKLREGSTFHFTIPLTPVREIKSIKLLFSPQTKIEDKLKKLMVEVLGPMGQSEFFLLKQFGLKYEDVKNYLTKLSTQGLIDEFALSKADQQLQIIFEVKQKKQSKKVDIPAAIKNIYVNQIGPMGVVEFGILFKEGLNYNNVFKNIKNLKQIKVIKESEYQTMKKSIEKIFSIKKSKLIDIPVRLRKIYLELLGPMGDGEFNSIKSKLTANDTMMNINYLEKSGIIKGQDASKFRDIVVNLFKQKTV